MKVNASPETRAGGLAARHARGAGGAGGAEKSFRPRRVKFSDGVIPRGRETRVNVWKRILSIG
jgi:hypothetical protein